jgi:hypothetical protein
MKQCCGCLSATGDLREHGCADPHTIGIPIAERTRWICRTCFSEYSRQVIKVSSCFHATISTSLGISHRFGLGLTALNSLVFCLELNCFPFSTFLIHLRLCHQHVARHARLAETFAQQANDGAGT